MTVVVWTYFIYVVVSLGLTWWVARTLSRSGATFLVDVMDGDTERADDVNRLLVVGFWLINLGFVAANLRIGGDVDDLRGAVEALAPKLGGVAVIVGILHLGVIFVLSRIRHGRRMEKAWRMAPPIPYAPQVAGFDPAFASPATQTAPVPGPAKQ